MAKKPPPAETAGELDQDHFRQWRWKTVAAEHGLTKAQLDYIEQQTVAHRAFKESAEGQAIRQKLDEIDDLKAMRARQDERSLPNVLDQEDVLRKLDARIAGLTREIMSDELTLCDDAAGASPGRPGIPSESRATAAESAQKPHSNASHKVHVLENRRNTLDPVIDRATEIAGVGADGHAVWNALVQLALEKKCPPLLGYACGEVLYSGGRLSKASFLKRWKRRRA